MAKLSTGTPYHGTGMTAKCGDEAAQAVLGHGSGKAKARYPSKPAGNQSGGGGSTGGAFKRAMTPGTSPAGS